MAVRLACCGFLLIASILVEPRDQFRSAKKFARSPGWLFDGPANWHIREIDGDPMRGRISFKHSKGEDQAEWPPEFRVQQMPEVQDA